VPHIWVTHINSSTTYGGRILLGDDFGDIPTFVGGSVGHRIPIGTDVFCAFFSMYVSFWGELGWGNNVVNATLGILRHGCVLLKMCNVTAHTLT